VGFYSGFTRCVLPHMSEPAILSSSAWFVSGHLYFLPVFDLHGKAKAVGAKAKVMCQAKEVSNAYMNVAKLAHVCRFE